MSANARFAIMAAASLIVFLGVLRLAIGGRPSSPPWRKLGWVALVVIAVGMPFGRFGAQAGMPWWIYYTVPALLTLALPPLALRMRPREVLRYLVLAAPMAPLIHVVFSFALGWNEYMPFLVVPAWRELFG
jgi:hypothetical protein